MRPLRREFAATPLHVLTTEQRVLFSRHSSSPDPPLAPRALQIRRERRRSRMARRLIPDDSPRSRPQTQAQTHANKTESPSGQPDMTTASLSLSYQPCSTYGTRSALTSSYSMVDPTLSYTDANGGGPNGFKTESVSGTLVLAHCIQPNIELSLAATWSFAKSPYSGSTNGTSYHNTAASIRRRRQRTPFRRSW